MSGVLLDMPMGGLLGGLFGLLPKLGERSIHPRRDANSGRLASLSLVLDRALGDECAHGFVIRGMGRFSDFERKVDEVADLSEVERKVNPTTRKRLDERAGATGEKP